MNAVFSTCSKSTARSLTGPEVGTTAGIAPAPLARWPIPLVRMSLDVDRVGDGTSVLVLSSLEKYSVHQGSITCAGASTRYVYVKPIFEGCTQRSGADDLS